MEISNRAGELIARKIFGQASREELKELEVLNMENPGMLNLIRNLEELINISTLESQHFKDAEIKKRTKLKELLKKAERLLKES